MKFVYLIIIFIVIIEICAQFCLKKGYFERNKFLYFIGFVSYALIGYLLLTTYHYNGMGYSNLLWSALSIIFTCITGKIFFEEKINYGACLLTLGAVFLIHIDNR